MPMRKKAEGKKTISEEKEGKTEEKEKQRITLIISEKPQASMKIAYALADIAPVARKVGQVTYFEANRGNEKIIVGCAVGHLFTLTETGKKKFPNFDIEWVPNWTIKGSEHTKKYLEVLKMLARKATDYVVACDYDIEGEVIGLNVIRFACNQKDAKRMKFSTLTKEDLNHAYENLSQHLDWGLAYAGETRHYLDWFYGINLSRALMTAIKKAGAFRILSIGRVQGPALALVVKKEKEILAFKSQPYWQVSLIVKNGQELLVKYPSNIFQKK
jgi:DNA topoisomerase-1